MHEWSGASMMTRREKVRNAGLLVLGTFIVVGTGITYRALVDRWKGDPRGTLIAAAFAGIAFFVSTVLTLSWAERREELKRRKSPN
jgi:O-antigen/teichoic acid export membrane protein